MLRQLPDETTWPTRIGGRLPKQKNDVSRDARRSYPTMIGAPPSSGWGGSVTINWLFDPTEVDMTEERLHGGHFARRPDGGSDGNDGRKKRVAVVAPNAGGSITPVATSWQQKPQLQTKWRCHCVLVSSEPDSIRRS